MNIKKAIGLFTLLALTACSCGESQNNSTLKEEKMDNQMVEIEMKSKLSDKTLVLKLPRCFLGKRIQNSTSLKQESSSVYLDYPRLAFSGDIKEQEDYQCPEGDDSRLVKIGSINPLEKELFNKNTYFLDSRKEMGSFFLEKKMALIFIKQELIPLECFLIKIILT